MTMMGICARCAEEKPTHASLERRRVSRGPNGDLLCGRHFREAWREHDDHDEPLSAPLEKRGFRAIESPLPGDWATNVQMSIQITSKRDVDRRRTYVARVYDAPADSLELPRVQLLAEAQAGDHVEATRRALEAADDNNEDPWLILDCDDEVVDTAKSGSEAMQKKEEIEERVPWGSPYEIESS